MPKDGQTDDIKIADSTGKSAEPGSSCLAQSVLGRYTDTPTHARSSSFSRLADYPRLAGEKSLSLARDLIQRWKSGVGDSNFTGRPLPFLRKVSRIRPESGVVEAGVSDVTPIRQPEASTVFPQRGDHPVTDTDRPGAETIRGRSSAASHTTGFILLKQDEALSDNILRVTALQQPGPGGPAASEVSSAAADVNRYGSGGKIKNIPGMNGSSMENFPRQSPAAGQAMASRAKADLGPEIMKRHARPTLMRLYRQSGDVMHSLQARPVLSETIAESNRSMFRQDSVQREETTVKGGDANSRLFIDHSPLQGKRLSRRVSKPGISDVHHSGNLSAVRGPAAGIIGHGGENPVHETVESMAGHAETTDYHSASNIFKLPESPISVQAPERPAGNTAATVLSLSRRDSETGSIEEGGYFKSSAAHLASTLPLAFSRISLFRTSSNLQKMRTSPILPGIGSRLAAGLRPLLSRMETTPPEILTPDAANLQISARRHGIPAVRRFGEALSSHAPIDTGTCSFFEVARPPSASGALSANSASTGLSNPDNYSGVTAAVSTAQTVHVANEPYPVINPFPPVSSGGSFIFRLSENNGLFLTGRREPLNTPGTGNMPVAGSRGTAVSLFRCMNRFAGSSVMSGFPPRLKAIQVKSNLPGSESLGVFEAVEGRTSLPFPVNSGEPEKIPHSRDIMPLVIRKENTGSGLHGAGNGGATAGIAMQQDFSGRLRRSPEHIGGESETSAIPASASGPQASDPRVPSSAGGINPEPLDLERIADEVYLILERRLVAEKERKGL